MMKKNISQLLEKFKTGLAEGKDPYFDSEEIEDLLNGISDEEAKEYLIPILDLGLRLYPFNQSLLIKRIEKECINENYETALSYAEELKHVDDPDLHVARLECFCMLEEYHKAVTYLDNLEAEKNEYLEEVYESFINILADHEFYTVGITFAKKAIKLFPDNNDIQLALLYIYFDYEKNKEVIRLATKLTDKMPYSYDVWYMLGASYARIEEFNKAIEALDFALTCKDCLESKMLKGFCLAGIKNYKEALEINLEVNKEKPTSLVQQAIVQCYSYLGQNEKAKLLSRFLIEVYKGNCPRSVLGCYLNTCMVTSQEEEMIDALKTLASTGSQHKMHLFLQMMVSSLMDLEDSTDYSEEILKLKIEFGGNMNLFQDMLFKKGFFHFAAGEVRSALQYLEELEEENSDYYLLHPLLTLCYLETGNKDRFLNQISLLPKDRLTVLSKINHIHFNPVHDKIMPRSKDLSSILIKNINNYN